MSYFKTKYGQIIDDNNQLIPMSEDSPLYASFLAYLENDGEILNTDFVFPEDLEREQKDATKNRYEKYKDDGWEAYQEFRAELVRKIDGLELTEPQAFVIESYLSIGYDKIAQNGDWKTAMYRLNQVTLQPQHQFVASYLSKALQIISNYVLENYPVR